jgi:hypothetical protein
MFNLFNTLFAKGILGTFSLLFGGYFIFPYIEEFNNLKKITVANEKLLIQNNLQLASSNEKILELEKILKQQNDIISNSNNFLLEHTKALYEIKGAVSHGNGLTTNDYLWYIGLGLGLIGVLCLAAWFTFPSNQTIESLCKNASLEAGEIIQSEVMKNNNASLLQNTKCINENIGHLASKVNTLEHKICTLMFNESEKMRTFVAQSQTNLTPNYLENQTFRQESLYSMSSTVNNTLTSAGSPTPSMEAELGEIAQQAADTIIPLVPAIRDTFSFF